MFPMASSADNYKGPVGPLRHRCAQCLATEHNLSRCAGCRAVRYCSREHQAAHRGQHKVACNMIKQARATLAEEEEGVRHATPDATTPANAFDTHVGHFCALPSTRAYMQARFTLLCVHLLVPPTLDGVQESLEHMRGMLRLCRCDPVRVRNMVPALLLRLDRDQECYDFVKWWSTRDPTDDFDCADMSLPYLDIRGADVFEEPTFLLQPRRSLDHRVAILILKLKLLMDIRNLRVARRIFARRPLPAELRVQIEQALTRSPLSASLYQKDTVQLMEVEDQLCEHASRLANHIAECNPHFSSHLFKPDEALAARPESTSRGSWEEMAMVMQNCYAACWETESLLDLLKDARACAARNSESDVDYMMTSKTFRSGCFRDGKKEDLLWDLSIGRMWDYLGQAVENAYHLGPWHARPSEHYFRILNQEVDDRYDSSEFDSEDQWY